MLGKNIVAGKLTRETKINTVIFFIVMFIACSPLFTKNCINGHDIAYHLLRIESLKEGILIGHPFLKVNVLFLGGAGYASSMFYPDFLLYFPALLRVFGVSINTSYHLFVAFCFVICYASTFYCTKQITKSSYAGTIAAVVLTLCQYHVDDVYIRSAVGEYTAFIFIPFVIYGIYDILYEHMKKPWVFALGFAGVLLCHFNSFVMCIVLCFLIFLIKIKVFLKEPKLVIKVLLTTIVTVMVTIAYWLPVLEQMISTEFYVNHEWIFPADAMQEVSTVFSSVFPALGFALFVIIIPRIFVKKTEDNTSLIEFTDLILFFGICFALAATRLLPWERIGRYVDFIQFPWRLYTIASVCLAICGAVILYMYFTSSKTREYILLAVIIMMCASAVYNIERTQEGYYSYSNDYFEYIPYTANIIAGEWLPVSVENLDYLMSQAEVAKNDKGNEIAFKRESNKIIITQVEKDMYIDVPFVYYKGYSAYIKDNAGDKEVLKVTGDGENGLCRVWLPEGDSNGTIIVEYKGTLIQKASFILTIVCLGYAFVVNIHNRRKSRRDQIEEV